MLEMLKKDDMVLFSNGDEAFVVYVRKRKDGWYEVHFNKRVYGTQQSKDNWWVYDKNGYPYLRHDLNVVSIIKVIHARESKTG